MKHLVLLGIISTLWTQLAIAQTNQAIPANEGSLNKALTTEPVVGSQLPFRLIEPEVTCPYVPYRMPGMFIFRTSGRDTSAIWYKAIGITGWTKNAGPHIINPACDVQPFTLQAYQESHPNDIVTYTWDYKAKCPQNCSDQTQPTLPPIVGLGDPTYNCSTGEFTFRSGGGDGSQVTYRAVGITDWTTSAGPFIVKPACDVEPFLLMARQASQPERIRYWYWDYRAQCPQNCPDSSAVITYCNQPHVLNGKPLSVSAAFVCNTNPNSFFDELRVSIAGGVADANSRYEWSAPLLRLWVNYCSTNIENGFSGMTFTINARQVNIYNGTIHATAQTTIVQSCPLRSEGGRLADKSDSSLNVHVLGNPTLADAIDVEIEGGVGQQVQILVSDAQGTRISQQVIEQATPNERVQVPLGKASGLYLLKVVTPFQQKIVKLIRQ